MHRQKTIAQRILCANLKTPVFTTEKSYPLTFNGSVQTLLRNYRIYGAEGGVGDLVTDTEDENYGKYKIPVTASGKNMAAAQQVYSTASNYYECTEDGRNCIRCTSSGKSYAGINFKENTQYTVRFEAKTVIMSAYEEDGNGEALFAFTHTDGTRKLIVVYGSKDWKYYEATSLANKTIASVGMYAYNYKHWIYINIDTFQIEEGTTATEYETYKEPITTNIYLDEPLRKLVVSDNISLPGLISKAGDYADYIDFKMQGVKRYVSQSGGLLYTLKTPVFEEVYIPAIAQHKNTNILTADTAVQPSGMEAKYI